VARSTAAVALARLRTAGFLEWTRRGVTVSRRVRGVESSMFIQVTNAYRLAASPPALPHPDPHPRSCLPSSESEGRPETRVEDLKRALAQSQTGAARDMLALDAALDRLGTAMQARAAMQAVEAGG
jgi:hypothetical protein